MTVTGQKGVFFASMTPRTTNGAGWAGRGGRATTYLSFVLLLLDESLNQSEYREAPTIP